MSERVRRNVGDIKRLRRMNNKSRKNFLKHCSSDLIDCLCECSQNLLHGNVPVTSAQFKKLKKYKKVLRKISNKKLSSLKRRKLLTKQSGGFLGALIGPLIGLVSSLFGNLFNRG